VHGIFYVHDHYFFYKPSDFAVFCEFLSPMVAFMADCVPNHFIVDCGLPTISGMDFWQNCKEVASAPPLKITRE
jgi:hypothetical protein